MIYAIVLGVLALAVLVLAFLASKYWHWAHVLTLVAFFFASVGYALLAAQSLSIRLEFQEKAAKAQERLDEQITLNDAISLGSQDNSIVNKLRSRDLQMSPDADGVRGLLQARHDLSLISRARGRVWRFAKPLGVDPQTRIVTVGFPFQRQQPSPDEAESFDEAPAEPAGPPPALGLEPESVVYVFQQGPALTTEQNPTPRQYLGEFRVTEVAGREARLEPLDQLALDPAATERYLNAAGGGPWVVYETMPGDRRDLFSSLNEELLRRLLPEASINEYLRDGTDADEGNDPPARIVGFDEAGRELPPDQIRDAVTKRYRRALRDYSLLLNGLEQDRSRLESRRQALTEDVAKLDASLEGAKSLQAYREAERAKWRTDLAAVRRDREAVEAHAQRLTALASKAKQLLEATLKKNAQAVNALAARGEPLTPVGSGALDIDAL